jgi:hypothetical protein
MDKDKLINEAHQLAMACSRKEVAQQIKPAFSYLIYHRGLGQFKTFLQTKSASKRSDRHWEEARKHLKKLLEKGYSVDELLFIMGIAIRLMGYYHLKW